MEALPVVRVLELWASVVSVPVARASVGRVPVARVLAYLLALAAHPRSSRAFAALPRLVGLRRAPVSPGGICRASATPVVPAVVPVPAARVLVVRAVVVRVSVVRVYVVWWWCPGPAARV